MKENNTPKVSIIMGTYNSQETVISSIESIINQTYKDWEFIIIDDGSIDNTYRLLKEKYNSDSRIIIKRNKQNLGLAQTLNNCLEVARGTYIARMDSDDISHPERIQKQVSFLEKNKEFSFTGCNAELFDGRGVWGVRKMYEYPDKEAFLFGSPFIHPTIMIKKEVYNNLNGYRVCKETLRAEDYDLFMRIYETGLVGYNIQENLYKFREDSNAYKRRKYKYRIDEFKIRYEGFKRLKLMPKGYIYMLKPLIVGLIPQKILAIFRNEKV